MKAIGAREATLHTVARGRALGGSRTGRAGGGATGGDGSVGDARACAIVTPERAYALAGGPLRNTGRTAHLLPVRARGAAGRAITGREAPCGHGARDTRRATAVRVGVGRARVAALVRSIQTSERHRRCASIIRVARAPRIAAGREGRRLEGADPASRVRASGALVCRQAGRALVHRAGQGEERKEQPDGEGAPHVRSYTRPEG